MERLARIPRVGLCLMLLALAAGATPSLAQDAAVAGDVLAQEAADTAPEAAPQTVTQAAPVDGTAAGAEAPAEAAGETAAETAGETAGETAAGTQPAAVPTPAAPKGTLVPADRVTVCSAVVEGVAKTLGYDAENPEVWSSRRERWSLPEGRCPARVVIADMAPDLAPREREVFCLQRNDAGGYAGLAMGERDGYGLCAGQGRICRFVKRTRDDAGQVAAIATQQGLQAVRDTSGAMVMSGSATSIAGTLAGLGSTAAGLATAPFALAGAAASAVVVGGAVWVCEE